MQAEDVDVVRHVAYNGNVAWIDDRYDSAEKPRSADAAREDCDVHAAEGRSREASARRVCAPTRSATRARSSSVSTSSMRFGASSTREGARAAKRAALPGP